LITDTDRKCPKCNGIIRYYEDDYQTGINFYYCEHHDYFENYPLSWKLLVDPIDWILEKLYNFYEILRRESSN